MTDGTVKKSIYTLLILALLVVLSIPFQVRIDRIRDKFRSEEESIYLSSSALKKLSLCYYELLADIYWLRALQYFGSRNPKSRTRNFSIISST